MAPGGTSGAPASAPAQSSSFRDPQEGSPAGSMSGERAAPTASTGADSGFRGFLNRLVSNAPAMQGVPISQNVAPIIQLAQAFSNAVGGASIARSQQGERARDVEESQRRTRLVSAQEKEIGLRAQEAEQRASEHKMRMNDIVADKMAALTNLESLQSPEQKAVIARSGNRPKDLADAYAKGDLEKFTRGYAMYAPAAQRQLEMTAETILADPKLRTAYAIQEGDKAGAMRVAQTASEVGQIYTLAASRLAFDRETLELKKMQKESGRDDAMTSLSLTNMYDALLAEEAKDVAPVEAEAAALARLMETATSPDIEGEADDEARTAAKTQLTQLGLTGDPTSVLDLAMTLRKNIDQRKQNILKTVDRFDIKGLRADLEARVSGPPEGSNEAKMNAMFEELMGKDSTTGRAATTSAGEEPLSLGDLPGIRAADRLSPLFQPARIDKWVSAVIDQTIRGNIDPKAGTRGLGLIARQLTQMIQGGFEELRENTTMADFVSRADAGKFDDRDGFNRIRESVHANAAVKGMSISDKQATHDAAVISWWLKNKPDQPIPAHFLNSSFIEGNVNPRSLTPVPEDTIEIRPKSKE